MNDSSFLEAILEDPEDDTLRLVYADWLEEQGSARGEFIRVQCELAENPADEERKRDLVVREAELLAEHEEEWNNGLADMVTRCVFVRGFVEHIVLPMTEFAKHAGELFRRAPIRTAMLNCHYSQDSEALANCDALERLRGIAFGAIDDICLRHIFEARKFERLERLVLSGNRLHDVSVQVLAETPTLSGLQLLDLSSNAIRNAGAVALANSRYIRGLTTLLLARNEIRLTGTRALARSSNFDLLEYLDFRGNPIDQRGVELLRNRFERWGCDV